MFLFPFDHNSPHSGAYQPRRYRPRRIGPPLWLLAVLAVCLLAVAVFFLTRGGGPALGRAAEPTPSPTPEATPTPTPTPTPEPTPTPTPPPDYTQPVPQGEAKELTWFDDAVFIGDSRTVGLQMYGGISGADFLDFTGLSVYKVMDNKPVIRSGEEKISVLDALSQKAYQKVYISLGINELGYYDPQGYAKTFASLVDEVRRLQPEALVYIQNLIPVNSEACVLHKQADYVNNQGVADYNAALAQMCAEKEVPLVNVAEALVDDTGEPPSDLTADGVHFQKPGYLLWRDYLLCHTGR